MFKSNCFYCPSTQKNLQSSYFLNEGQIKKKTEVNIKRTRKTIFFFSRWKFYAFSFSSLSLWVVPVLGFMRRLSSSLSTVQQGFCRKDKYYTKINSRHKRTFLMTTACVLVLRKHTETRHRGSHGCKCFHIQKVCRWFSVWRVRKDVYLEEKGHLLFSCAPAALGDELQNSHQRSQAQPNGQNQKHPLQAVRLHRWRLGPLCKAAAGPPLAPQVG